MAIGAKQVTVASTATALTFTEVEPMVVAFSMAIYNAGAVTVYVGPSSVTASGATQGFPLAAGQSMTFDNVTPSDVYGIVTTGTCVVNLFATGL